VISGAKAFFSGASMSELKSLCGNSVLLHVAPAFRRACD
jgi:hypothetical protein